MNPNDIKAVIDTYGAPVWNASMKQVGVAFWQDLAWAVLGILLMVPFWVVIRRTATALGETDSDSRLEWRVALGAAVTVAFLVALFFIVQPLGEAWTIAANPEWMAMKNILSAVKK